MCGLCDEYIPSGSSAKHVWHKHLDIRPLVCSICNKEIQYAMSSNVRKHMITVHDDHDSTIIDNTSSFKNVYREMRNTCFPFLGKGEVNTTPIVKKSIRNTATPTVKMSNSNTATAIPIDITDIDFGKLETTNSGNEHDNDNQGGLIFLFFILF